MERVGLYIVVSMNTVYSKFSSYTCKHILSNIYIPIESSIIKCVFLIRVPGGCNTISAIHVAPQSVVPAFHIHSFVRVRTEKVSLRLD